ncbi:MAG: glycosyltransferase [Planctomycetes bacterium]|nr:glycosyltransferase [Planctomycetota bacterium]
MYTQVRNLPRDIDCHVVCESVANLDQFALPNLHHVRDGGLREYWERGLRKLRLRDPYAFLVERARALGARVLHSHFGDTAWRQLEATRRAGLRHVVTFYGFDVNMLPQREPEWRERYRELFAQGDLFLCEGPHMARCLVALGCPERKVRVHHLGVSLQELEFRPRSWRRGAPLRVLIAASFHEKKGIPDALAALRQLRDEVPLEIVLVGDAVDAPRSIAEKGRILEAIARLGLADQVRLLGFQPHRTVFEEAYRSHVFLAASRTASDGDTEGGAPVTVIEMSATGMPIVATTHCDIPEVVQHGRTGMLAAEGDVDGLVAQLRWYVEHPERWGELGAAARRRMEEEFDARAQGERLARLYREVACC